MSLGEGEGGGGTQRKGWLDKREGTGYRVNGVAPWVSWLWKHWSEGDEEGIKGPRFIIGHGDQYVSLVVEGREKRRLSGCPLC